MRGEPFEEGVACARHVAAGAESRNSARCVTAVGVVEALMTLGAELVSWLLWVELCVGRTTMERMA